MLVLLLSSCDTDSAKRLINPPTATIKPIQQPSEVIPTEPQPEPPTEQAAPDADWQALETGLEFREFKAEITTVQVLRIDPAVFRVRVAYDVVSPGRVGEWADALDPVAVINGGYFDPQGRATALTIYDGVVRGTSYDGFGGMFSVDINGVVQLRSLREQPYDPSENLAQALQSSPMLVLHGEVVPQPNDDGDRARRSVVALDTSGRILLIVWSWPLYTLTQTAEWLVQQPLNIDNALNLDGGSSTGLVLNSEKRAFRLDSLVRVPQVLLIERP